jgi:hypothetical protein
MDGACRARERAPGLYAPRRPSQSVLYRCVQEHLATWLAQCRDGHHDAGPVTAYVEREFRRYLECGILAHGFARARCGPCGHDFLIAFSCKGRGVCPACNTRRMVETAAHLTAHVLPDLPLRQWVLAVPKRLRYFLERDAELQGAALHLFLREVEQCLRAHSPGSSGSDRPANLRRLYALPLYAASRGVVEGPQRGDRGIVAAGNVDAPAATVDPRLVYRRA